VYDYYDEGGTLYGPGPNIVFGIGGGLSTYYSTSAGNPFISWDIDTTGQSVGALSSTSFNGNEQAMYIESVGATPTYYVSEPSLYSGGAAAGIYRIVLRKAVAGNITIKGSTSTVLVEGTTSYTWSGPVGDTMILQYFLPYSDATYGGTVSGWRIVGGTAANAIAGGISATVTLAKLTGGGANGSLTFTNGLLTAKTDPT